MQVLKAFETGYCQPPPPGCPRNIYKLMVDCWWVQQWLASQNLLLKLATVTRRYIYGVNKCNCHTANWRWAFSLEYSMNMCYSWMPTARWPTCCLVYNSVEFAMFEKCLCSHNTTPHFPLPSYHAYLPQWPFYHIFVSTQVLGLVYNQSFPHPTLNLQEPRTSCTSDIWRHHSGPGQRPCSTAELESTGQSNPFQSCCFGSTSGGREASLQKAAEQVPVVEILYWDAVF